MENAVSLNDIFLEHVVILVLFLLLIAITIAMVRMRSLFAMAMMTGIFSLLCAGLFTALDAVDVAFTEAAVGAGMSTVLFLGTMALTGSIEKPIKGVHWPALALAFLVGALLVYGTWDMPRFGDPEAPIHVHVADRYVEASGSEVGPPNIVTSVLASYRGYDTLGEVTVVFTAGLAVVVLLGGSQLTARLRYREDKPDAGPRDQFALPGSSIPSPNPVNQVTGPTGQTGKAEIAKAPLTPPTDPGGTG